MDKEVGSKQFRVIIKTIVFFVLGVAVLLAAGSLLLDYISSCTGGALGAVCLSEQEEANKRSAEIKIILSLIALSCLVLYSLFSYVKKRRKK